MLERERWRAAGLAEGLKEQQLALCPQKRRQTIHEAREWVLLGEAFGDLVCESAKSLRQLLGAASMREIDAGGWSQELSDEPPAKRCKRTAGCWCWWCMICLSLGVIAWKKQVL